MSSGTPVMWSLFAAFVLVALLVFAILGLRAMYFLLAGMQERFHLLSYGLALILAVIGTKMLLVDVYKVPVLWSLAVTGTILLVTILLSLAVPPMKGAHRGAYPFAKKKPQERSPS